MVAFMVFVTGAAVAMACFYLSRAMIGFTPDFDRGTLDEVGMVAAFAIYCGAGPVLLVRSIGRIEPATTAMSLRYTVIFTCLILIWTGSLGIVAVESTRALL